MSIPSTELEKLRLSEDNADEENWNSESTRNVRKISDENDNPSAGDEDDREAALRAELETVRDINRVISGVLDSLQRAKGNMETVSRTIGSASTLLDTWTRILSQTEHTQRLILNPSWQGASKDIADIEREALLKQQEAERKELEEQRRKEALARKQEEEERKRTQASSTVRGARGTARATRSRISYLAQSSSHGSVRSATRGSSTASTTGSGIRRPVAGSTRTTGIARSTSRARGP
ncbi:hypothetical protein VTO42DRAFT_4767 [Malbranchea cinnamomea]